MAEKRRTTIEEARRVGDEIGVDWERFDLEQFRAGMDVEFEHGSHDPQTDVTHDDPIVTAKDRARAHEGIPGLLRAPRAYGGGSRARVVRQGLNAAELDEPAPETSVLQLPGTLRQVRGRSPSPVSLPQAASLASAGVILRAVTPKAILCIFAGHRWVIEPNHDAVTRLTCRRCGNSRVESGEMRGITGYGRSTQRGIRR
jgi:hypothetical protein